MVNSQLTMFIVTEGSNFNFRESFWTRDDAQVWAKTQPPTEFYLLRVTPGDPETPKEVYKFSEGIFTLTSTTPTPEAAPVKAAPVEAPVKAAPVKAAPVKAAPVKAEEGDEEEDEGDETPKTRKKHVRLSPERIQECCDQVINLMVKGETYKRNFFLEAGVTPPEWTKVIQALKDEGKVVQEGVKKGAVYFLAEAE